MLVQHQGLPFFAIAGDFYSSSSTPSTLTHLQPPVIQQPPPPPLQNSSSTTPGVPLSLPLATTSTVLNQSKVLKSLATPDRLCRLYPVTQSSLPVRHSAGTVSTSQPTLQTPTMPRISQPKVDNHMEADRSGARAAHPSSVAVPGGKRNASVLSNTAPVAPALPATGSSDQPLRFPPKLKESERMMHVQRWVNHLSWSGDGTSGQTKWHYWYRHIDEDRELTPPPSRAYLSRLPFTPEEQQTMLRFFTPSSEYRPPQAGAGGTAPNTYPPNQLPYHHQRTTVLHQAAAAANQHVQMSAQQQQQRRAAAAAAAAAGNPNGAPVNAVELDRCGPSTKPSVPRRMDAEPTSRFFAEWETRLISHLFQDYFPGRGEPVGNTGVLPSLNEVRSRIASSRLIETRTAMAVRAKIKRMQSSGTWIEYP